MKTAKGNIFQVSLSRSGRISKKQRTPIQKVGQWQVKQYFEDNDYPGLLIDLYAASPTHGGIIDKKVMYTRGSKLKAVAKDHSQQAEVDNYSSGVGNDLGIHECFTRLAMDRYLYGGYALLVYTDSSAQLAGFKHVDFSLLRRASYDNEAKETVHGYVYSPDWRDETLTKKEAVWIAPFDPDGQYEPEAKYLVYRMRYAPGKHYYPTPDYHSAILSIETEAELINFKHKSTINSFNPGGFLTIVGRMDEAERERTRQSFEEFQNGTDNTGKLFVQIVDNESEGVQFVPFTNSPADKNVSAYQDQARQEIVSAHQLPSLTLIGLPGGPSLSGDASTISTSMSTFFETVIKPVRSELLDDLVWLYSLLGWDVTFSVEELVITETGQVDTATINQDGGTNEEQVNQLAIQQWQQ